MNLNIFKAYLKILRQFNCNFVKNKNWPVNAEY